MFVVAEDDPLTNCKPCHADVGSHTLDGNSSGGQRPKTSSFKNFNSGFMSAMSCIFFSLRHPLISFSRAMALLLNGGFRNTTGLKHCTGHRRVVAVPGFWNAQRCAAPGCWSRRCKALFFPDWSAGKWKKFWAACRLRSCFFACLFRRFFYLLCTDPSAASPLCWRDRNGKPVFAEGGIPPGPIPCAQKKIPLFRQIFSLQQNILHPVSFGNPVF